jgi:hypothetical protein
MTDLDSTTQSNATASEELASSSKSMSNEAAELVSMMEFFSLSHSTNQEFNTTTRSTSTYQEEKPVSEEVESTPSTNYSSGGNWKTF